MARRKDDSKFTFFAVIYGTLLNLVKLAYAREDFSWTADWLWFKISPYIDDELQKMWRIKAEGNSYNAKIWKVRMIMLTLQKIGVLPDSNAEAEKRVFGEYDPQFETPNQARTKEGEELFPKDDVSISGNLEFGDLMMHSDFLLADLVKEGYDLESMLFMADLQWAFCSPYITWEDMEDWQQKSSLANFNRWEWFKTKVSMISSILDREGIQFRRRAIDVIDYQEQDMVNPYIKDEDGKLKVEDDFEM